MSALDDAITTLQAEDTELAADAAAVKSAIATQGDNIAALQAQITDLENQIASGAAVTPEQIAALGQVTSDLAASHDAITAALPPGPATTAAPSPAEGSATA